MRRSARAQTAALSRGLILASCYYFVISDFRSLTLIFVQRPVVEQQEDDRRRYEHRLRKQPGREYDRDREIAGDRWFARVIKICREREHEEDSAQNVFAFLDPNDRFRPQWMNCKNRGGKRTSPDRSSEFPQREKKQDDSCGMKNNVRQMKQARIESVELELEHVRDVLERKPVRGGPMSEGPFDAVQRETGIYLRNFVNVFRVIEVDEGKFDCLPEHEPNERDQTDANAGD